jgi:hypothetical protein
MPGRQADVDPRILAEHRFRVILVPLLQIRTIGRALQLSGLERLENLLLFFAQSAHSAPPK